MFSVRSTSPGQKAGDRGQGLAEYIIVLILVGIIVLVAVRLFGRSTKCQFENASSQIEPVGSGEAGCAPSSSKGEPNPAPPPEPPPFVPPQPVAPPPPPPPTAAPAPKSGCFRIEGQGSCLWSNPICLLNNTVVTVACTRTCPDQAENNIPDGVDYCLSFKTQAACEGAAPPQCFSRPETSTIACAGCNAAQPGG